MRTAYSIILCFCVIIISSMVMNHAQTSPLQQMLGTWEWHSGSKTFRVVLQIEPKFKMPDGKTYNVVLGRHSYMRNGAAIEESLMMRGENGNPGFTLFSMPTNEKVLRMSFKDITKNKLGRVNLELAPNNLDELHWILKTPNETVGVNQVIPEGFTVPTDLLLKRVK